MQNVVVVGFEGFYTYPILGLPAPYLMVPRLSNRQHPLSETLACEPTVSALAVDQSIISLGASQGTIREMSVRGHWVPPTRGAAQGDEILSPATGKFRMVRRTRINPTKLRYHSHLNTWYSRYLLSFVASSVNHTPRETSWRKMHERQEV